MTEPALSTSDPQVVDLIAEYQRLQAVEREYQVTIKVVAVLTEIVSRLTQGNRVEITDAMIADSPSLTAWRDEKRSTVVIETSRP